MSELATYAVRLMSAAKRDISEEKMVMKQTYGVFQAAKMLQRIKDDLTILSTSPYSAPKVDDSRLRALGYRGLILDNGNKIAFYVIFKSKKLVQVRRILSCRQDYLRILYSDNPKRMQD